MRIIVTGATKLQVRYRYLFVISHDHGAFDPVLQFPHIAGPGIGLQRGERIHNLLDSFRVHTDPRG